MKWSNALLAVLAVIALSVSAAGATELIYTPVNPSFGGNPLNGTFLLNQAGAQNTFRESTTSGAGGAAGAAGLGTTDPVQSFRDQLNRRILSGLADRLVRTAFGEAGLVSGDYILGDFHVTVDVSNPTLTIVTIFDVATGNSATIEIPTIQ